jgi:hypothetical protein
MRAIIRLAARVVAAAASTPIGSLRIPPLIGRQYDA